MSKATNLQNVTWAGHSFLRSDRVSGAFPDFEPLVVSRGGMTYCELMDSGRSQDFCNDIETALKQHGGTVLVLVLGDNDFSKLTSNGIQKNDYYEEMAANPVKVVKSWRVEAHELNELRQSGRPMSSSPLSSRAISSRNRAMKTSSHQEEIGQTGNFTKKLVACRGVSMPGIGITGLRYS